MRKKKVDFLNNNLNKLQNVKCSKEWWSLSKSLKTVSSQSHGPLSSDDFYSHFKSLLSVEEEQTFSWCMPYNIDPFMDSPIEHFELISVINNLKNNKAPGLDGIPYEFFKNAPIQYLENVLLTFNKAFLNETIPQSFKNSILIPLFKKGDPNLATNYRGLSLINSIGKIFNNILLVRLENWLNKSKILNEYQAGFRKNYSTIDNIFNLINTIHLSSLKTKHTYAFFVDFSCAFDTIPRNCLFYKLSQLGVSSKFIRLLQLLYDDSMSRVWDGCTLSEEFTIKSGVKQGCVLSPVLFSLYLNDLPETLPGGLTVAGVSIKILLYADDIVILSDSPVGLQKMIDCLHNYCKQ